MRTQFCIYGEPRGKERPKFSTVCGHVTARTPENTVLYENLVKTEYRIQSGVRFADDAMLSVRIFCVPLRSEIGQQEKAPCHDRPPDTPDTKA